MNKPVRRSQAISPFGIGAMVDFPGPISLIHAGLDAWPFDPLNPDHREFIEEETRLAKRLGVEYFVQPPDFRRNEYRNTDRGTDAARLNLNLKLPFLRFPLWHVCPRCGKMFASKYHHTSAPKCTGLIGTGKDAGKSHPDRLTVQVRFVAACKHGHLQDFPWLEWVFKTNNPDWDTNDPKCWLRMTSKGSASLAGVEISAERLIGENKIEVVAKRSLAGAFEGDSASDGPSAFTKMKLFCSGHNPVLAIGENSSSDKLVCGENLYPLLRGASNLYFPNVVSSIYIPDVDDRNLTEAMLALLEDRDMKESLIQAALVSDNGLVSEKAARNLLRRWHPELDGEINPAELAKAANLHVIKRIILDNKKISRYLIEKVNISPKQILTADILEKAISNAGLDWEIDINFLLPIITTELFDGAENSKEESADDADPNIDIEYRHQEYEIFCRDVNEGYPKTNLLIKSSKISEYGSQVNNYFHRISLLEKLRETRAFVGFSRIFPESSLSVEAQRKLFSSKHLDWLPAIIVRGEGIFLKFDDSKIDKWLEKHGAFHQKRIAEIITRFDDLRTKRHQDQKEITPKFMMIHSFAHLLINQLIYDCGYGSASLRERIYVSDDPKFKMSGVLIYTAAGDSEGTMGGLVSMGKPKNLEQTIARAIEKASWCSSDPVCIESTGQGPDNCNLAACHSCALLPETSCEEQNRLLDRGVLIGTLENPKSGFFSDLF
ncbi:hypothetical protein M2125_000966 [Polynucleobacter sphagniphilus]|uniref:DUF1998 domain-containing protein n=1 Tax=Polynucleobacter sphagniphilus TaxID=1743169 RepID=UPI0024750FD2|nr:DUF1998 domain-containing protein [Polynucleobacter sphagniphilus]MDH6241159.1 hypothetical protein [Polynucleobacter sphagniphilus]